MTKTVIASLSEMGETIGYRKISEILENMGIQVSDDDFDRDEGRSDKGFLLRASSIYDFCRRCLGAYRNS